MTEPSAIFRPEALEAHAAGQRASGDALRADSRWVRWSYWAVLALVLGGLILAMLLRTEATATGTAVVNRDGTFSALVPASVMSQLRDARSVRIESVAGGDPVRATAKVTHIAAADDAAVSRNHLEALHQAAIMLSGTLQNVHAPPPQTRRSHSKARIVVVLRSESLVATLGRRLDGMLG
jgi:hypothetical protein